MRQILRQYIADGCRERCSWCPFCGYTVALLVHELAAHPDRMEPR